MKDLSTEDFVLFEDEKVFNNDSLIKLITGAWHLPKLITGLIISL